MHVSNLNIPVSVVPNLPTKETYRHLTSERLYCRDPYILLYGDTYYLYHRGTEGKRILCSVSDDLEHWSDPITVFDPPADFHGVKDLFWAPECHYYKGNFYIFTSVYSKKTGHRSISVYRSESPLGPFRDIADGCISPKDWDAIDGTLYVDPDGQPWMVFVHEWTSMPDHVGSMVAAKLSEDFTHLCSEPIHLFYAKDPVWATSGVTDGAYLCTDSNGHLMMIWSNFGDNGYVVGLAHSATDRIEGPWIQQEAPLYRKGDRPAFATEGGHGMIFRTKEGKMMLSYHGPNRKLPDGNYEHLCLAELREENGTITIV
jgi:beta-xylosidase